MSAYCRFELLLPLQFNDGTAVPMSLIAGVVTEIERRFGAASWESQIIEGIWHQGGVQFRDQLNRIFVDAQDSPEHRRPKRCSPSRKIFRRSFPRAVT
jgi:hypothetical protein